MSKRAFVLVHSPFAPASTWVGVAKVLAGRGFAAVAPSLQNMFAEGPPYYPAAACIVADATQQLGTDIVLVVHSGAGGLVDAICDLAHARTVIFVDAVLPFPGESWLSTLPPWLKDRLLAESTNGLLPRWDSWFGAEVLNHLIPDREIRAAFVAEVPNVPVTFASEFAPAESRNRPNRNAYLELSSAYGPELRAAKELGWPTRSGDETHHLAMVIDPRRVADVLEALSDIHA